jgi:hypothetical protein
VSDPVVEDGTEVPSPEPVEGVVPEAPATDFAAQATEYKNRFAGSQRSLRETQSERDALKAERDALAAFKASQERASMTELQALQADLDLAKQEAAAARAEAQREKLARQFPQSAAVFGDKMPTDEEVLATLEQRLAGKPPEESEPEPVIDPNHPRKQPIAAPDPMDAVDAWMRSTFNNGG